LLTQSPEILRKALFRGGLHPKTLQNLIETDDGLDDEMEEPQVTHTTAWGNLFRHPTGVEVTITKPPTEQLTPDPSEPNAGITGFLSRPRADRNRSASFAATDPYNTVPDDDDNDDDDTGKNPRKKGGRLGVGDLLTSAQRVTAAVKPFHFMRREPFTSPAFRLGQLIKTL
jgi:hypothetical protein